MGPDIRIATKTSFEITMATRQFSILVILQPICLSINLEEEKAP